MAASAGARAALAAMGHPLRPLERAYGNMQAVVWDYTTNTLDAAADPRGHGAAAVAPR